MTRAIAAALRRARDDERGIGVVTALMIAFVVFAVAGLWASNGVHSITASGAERDRERAFAAAEAGINAAMARFAAAGMDCSPMSGSVEGATYTVDFDTTLCADPAEDVRYIIARGYSGQARRQLEQQVKLVPLDGFRYALFSAPGQIGSSNNMTVKGDVYSSTDLTIANWGKVFGNVIARGDISITGNTIVAGDAHAEGSVTIVDAGGTVEGDALASGVGTRPGNISVKGWVKGNAQAKGTVTLQTGGKIDGYMTSGSAPPPPPPIVLPTFTPEMLSYTSSWTSAPTFRTSAWEPNIGGFAGTYRIAGANVGTLLLDKRWTISGTTFIVSDGPVVLSREVLNGTSEAQTLAIVSLSSSTAAIEMTNNITLPANVKVLLYAPNGCINFRNLKSFSGVVYASCMQLDQQFTLTFAPIDVPGFTWTTASASHFTIESTAFREVQFQAP